LIPDNAPEGRSDAFMSASGIEMRAVANAWSGTSKFATDYTPIWIQLKNTGTQTFDITFPSLLLIDQVGKVYMAVPPQSMMQIAEEDPPLGPVLVASLDGDSDAPEVLPVQYVPFTPFGMPIVPTAHRRRNRPTELFREGRLLPGTQASGFVFFQKAYEAQQLTLQIQAVPEEVAPPPGQPPTPPQAPTLLTAHFTVKK
jgi:hypothetical protein